MTKLYLIRHGQSEWNKLAMIQGQKNTKLTELGKIQAEKLGKRLVEENLDLIYASDLERAYNTASIISKETSTPIIVSQALREKQFGVWEGLTIENIMKDFSEEYSIWLKEPNKLLLDGAEGLENLIARSMEFVNNVIETNKGKRIALVSHGATLKTILLGLLGLDTSYYKNFTLGNVSLTTIECRQYNNVVTLLNDRSHLKGL